MQQPDCLRAYLLFFCLQHVIGTVHSADHQDIGCSEAKSSPCCSNRQKNIVVYSNETSTIPDLEPLHREIRTGVTVSSIYVQMSAPYGNTAKLPCPVRQLGNRTVSWLHHLGDSVNLLTVGSMVYTNNNRLSIDYRYPGNWTLKISGVQLEDGGCYECQVNTHPPISVYVLLHIHGPAVHIVDQRNESIHEALFKTGALIQLTCIARAVKDKHLTLTWFHGTNKLNQDVRRGGINIRTERWQDEAISWLFMAKSTTRDSGSYSCDVNNQSNATVYVHIIQGEQQAAVQDYASGADDTKRILTSTRVFVATVALCLAVLQPLIC